MHFVGLVKTEVVSFLDVNTALNLKASCRGMYDVFDLYSDDVLLKLNGNFIAVYNTVQKFDEDDNPIDDFYMKA